MLARIRRPSRVSDQQAAATSLVGITAHLGLVRDARLRSGETLFIHGGTGGVGSMVVQMAKIHRRAGDHHRQQRREAGAYAASLAPIWRSTTRPKTSKPRQRSSLRPASMSIGKPIASPISTARCGCSPLRGRMILMAGRDARPQFPVGPFYVKGCHLMGFAMFNATPDEQRAAAEDINRWLAAGQLKPIIDRVLPLSEAATGPSPARRQGHRQRGAGDRQNRARALNRRDRCVQRMQPAG